MTAARRIAAVVGGGSWGTALALHLSRAGYRVPLWVHDAARLKEMRAERENRTYLPDFPLPEGIEPTGDLEEVVSGRGLVLWVVPARYLREVVQSAGPHLSPGARLVIATKGIEPETGFRMSEVVQQCLEGSPRRVAVLAGPSFAREVARGDPTAGVLACRDPREAEELQEDLSYGPFRVYTNTDLVGVEMGGALKNVIALAAGVVEGLGLGSNSLAALVTRGLTEITRLGVICGGFPSTFAGLAGLGDLVLTCTGRLSRNRFVGVELGEGRRLEEILAGMKMVAEGVPTTAAALTLGRRHGVELPITEQVGRILRGEVSPRDAVTSLLRRPLKGEESWG